MGFMRPATPGFLVTLIATILLALVSFSVPLIKSIYFLEASLTVENIDGTITFGTLGYCTTISGSTSCSNATVGYELDINQLVGNDTSIEIPTIVVKWLTYALVLHIVALGLAGIASIFGLLAHVREMSMTCCSSCISGFGAAVAFVAFIFDIALFFIAKSRMNSASGGSASMGNAIWLTLVAAVLLFFSGCFYGIGRCCIRRRGRDMFGGQPGKAESGFGNRDQLRLDAVKAEADRKAQLAKGEVGLPAFHEYEQSQPLKAKIDGDEVYLEHEVPYRDDHSVSTAGVAGRGTAYGGYAPAPVGTRAVDELNNKSPSYPPQRRASAQTQVTASSYPSSYPPSSHATAPTVTSSASPVIAPATTLAPVRQPSSTSYYDDPYGAQTYGHAAGSSPYAAAEQSYHNPYNEQAQGYYGGSPHNQDPYGLGSSGNPSRLPQVSPYDSYAATASHQPERSYTLSGNGYGTNVVPPSTQLSDPYGLYQNQNPTIPQPTASPPPIDTNIMRPSSAAVSPVRGPRGPRTSIVLSPPTLPYSDNPPDYDSGFSGVLGQSGKSG
ncbi:hypothetical protein ID866_6318 [Astraeus odoratus]|nr:hypothetical protein ID866_6318 [Astraeus odoratus]